MVSKYKKILSALGIAGALITMSTPAYGMAAVIPWVATALGIGAVAATAVVVVAAIVVTAALVSGISAMTPSFDEPDYSTNTADGAEAINRGILVNKTGTNNPIPVVYGKRKIGGSRVFVSTSGGDNQYLYIAMVFCEGEINAFKELLFDEKLVASGTLTTQIDNSAYSSESRLQYELQRGTTGQQSPDWFNQNGWSNNHNLSGLAVGYFKCRWVRPDIDLPAVDQQSTADDNPYGGVPRIQVVVEGKKVPDATSYVDGASTTYASMPKSYSTNPADHMLDYLMNPIFGRGLANDRMGFTSFKTAHNKFNTTVNYKTGGTGKILEFNYAVQTNRTMLENVQVMLQNMRSGMPYVQGKFNLKLLDSGHASVPTSAPVSSDFTTVTEREIIGGLTIDGKGHRDQYNQIKAVYPNPETNWELDEIVYPKVNSATDEALLAEDNGKRLSNDISLEGITNGNIAGDIASIVLLRSRKKKAVSFTATAELHNTMVGDLLKITYPNLGMTDAQFRITSHQITADYTVQITAIEHDPTVYDFTNTDVFIPKPVGVSSNSNATSGGNVAPDQPYFPAPVSGNAYISSIVESGTYKFRLTVVHAADVSEYDSLKIQQQATVTTDFPTGVSNSTVPIVKTAGKFGAAFDSSFNVVSPQTTSAYIWFRVIYVKTNGVEIAGPWKYIANSNPKWVQLYPQNLVGVYVIGPLI